MDWNEKFMSIDKEMQIKKIIFLRGIKENTTLYFLIKLCLFENSKSILEEGLNSRKKFPA